MRGVVFTGNRELDLLTFPDPTPGPDDAIIEVRASGFCGSDLKYYRDGHLQTLRSYGLREPDGPVIAGHEPAGVIAALGSNVNPNVFRVGDRVAVYHYDGCHYCDQCRSGWVQLCDRKPTVYGQTAHGSHAPYMKVPAKALIPLPEGISFSAGAAIACGTGTAYGAIVRLDLSGRDTLAVFGLGPVGQSAIQLASAMGAQVIAVDISPERVAAAREFGATHAINAGEVDAVEAILALTGGKGVSMAMECSGAAPARQAAVRATSTWGKTALVGLGGNLTLEVMKDLVAKQRTVIGALTFSDRMMSDCARFVAAHGIDVDKQFSHRWKLEQGAEAYREFDKQTSGKAVFEF